MTSRCARSLPGRSLISAASTAQWAQSHRALARCGAAPPPRAAARAVPHPRTPANDPAGQASQQSARNQIEQTQRHGRSLCPAATPHLSRQVTAIGRLLEPHRLVAAGGVRPGHHEHRPERGGHETGSPRTAAPRTMATMGTKYTVTAARADPTRAARVANAAAVPRHPEAATASRLGQADDDSVAPAMPNGDNSISATIGPEGARRGVRRGWRWRTPERVQGGVLDPDDELTGLVCEPAGPQVGPQAPARSCRRCPLGRRLDGPAPLPIQ